MKKCSKECEYKNVDCTENQCRYWIEFPEEHNCSLISIKRNGKMTLEQVGERLGLSFVRISQIEKLAMAKFKRILRK